jgi:hypothetical protein
MPYSLVQPWGRDRYRQATVVATYDTATEAFAELDRYADIRKRDGMPQDYLEFFVVDEQRTQVTRTGVALAKEGLA